MRLIDADAIQYWQDDSGIKNMDYVRRSQINSLPTIEAEPIKHGEWLPYGEWQVECSECGFVTTFLGEGHYCPRCGAIMDEVEE